MANFEFLKNQKEYILFANAAIEAEKVYATSPAMSAVGSRKALELAVQLRKYHTFSHRICR